MEGTRRPRVFISYRRTDTRAVASRLRDALRVHFGDELVFRDVESIDGGEPFPDVLHGELVRTSVVLALIGPDWLTAKDPSGRTRLELDDDWVRIELSTTLADGEVTVIPVFIDETPVPGAEQIVEPLRALVGRNAMRLRNDEWDHTYGEIVERLVRLGFVPADGPLRAPYLDHHNVSNPLRLLRADYRVVPFEPRDELTILDALAESALDDPRICVGLIIIA